MASLLPHSRHTRRAREAADAGPTARASSRELRILKTIAEALNGASNVDEALQTTLEQVAELLGLHAGWIWLTDPRTGRFYSAVARQLPPFLREPVRMTGRSCWCLRAFQAGELTAGNINVMACSRLREAVDAHDRAGTGNLGYHASIPLYFGGRQLGLMNVAAAAWRKLTPRELDLLNTIASQVGVAIERARLASESVQVARMEERAGLARQIHDTLAQRLTAIGLHLDAALPALPVQSPAAEEVQRALELARAGLDEARHAMRQLRSSPGRQLSEALDALTRAFTADTGIRVHVRRHAQNAAVPDRREPRAGLACPQLSATEEEELLLIAGEALTNVRKHAHATDVELTLARDDRGHLRLEIADNGRGFNPRARTAGFGLLGMRERAERLGGRLRIASTPRGTGGTRIVLTMPVTRPEGEAPA